MVIKTDTCSFSEMRIYPGHGSRFVRKDGQLLIFNTHKCSALYHLRKKPAKLTWTQAWRRMNKKTTALEKSSRRRTRRTARVQRAIAGVNMEDIRRKKQAPKAGTKSQAQIAAEREAKLRKLRQQRRK